MRSQCLNNTRNIALALVNYQSTHGSFPPAYLTDKDGRPAHSWRVLILPYLDHVELYKRYRFDEPWDGPNNSKLADAIPDVYRCPSFREYHRRHGIETNETGRLTNCVAITGIDGIFRGAIATPAQDVTDGLENTLLVIEARHHSVHWMQPDDVSENEIFLDLRASVREHHANHIGGLVYATADGRVGFLSSGTDHEVFHSLVTRNGGESLRDH